MIKFSVLGVLSLLIAVPFSSCVDNKENGTAEAFDRGLLLEQVGEKRILPAFEHFEERTERLSLHINAFLNHPTYTTLDSAQNAWEETFLSFQAIRGFTFGPGDQSLIGDINENLGTWPIDTQKVEQRILASDWNMNDFRRDTRGLLAVEYLLFSPNALYQFQNSEAQLRRDFLKALMLDIQNWASTQTAAWRGFMPQFKADVGKSSGSSTSELYNHWLQSCEGIKNFKLALPAGLRVGQTQAEPNLVESRYAHLSVASVKAHLMHIENLWYGNGLDHTPGIGFDDYLDKVEGGPALKAATIEQWNTIHQQLAKFDDSDDLAVLVVQDPQRVADLLNELQKMTRFIKSDLSSLLGIAITYSSGDGD